jgi:hypothetical protein
MNGMDGMGRENFLTGKHEVMKYRKGRQAMGLMGQMGLI